MTSNSTDTTKIINMNSTVNDNNNNDKDNATLINPGVYSKSDVKNMLLNYSVIEQSDFHTIPRYSHIRYWDTKFKSGGMLLKFTDNYFLLKNGTFIWKIPFANVKRIWVKNFVKNEDKELSLKLLQLYKNGRLSVTK